MRVAPPYKLGEGDSLLVSGRGVIPYSLEEGVTSRGSEGAPPPYPLATRLEGRSPRKLRIKLKPRSLGEPSQSCPETTTLYVVDAASTPRPLPGGEDIVPLEPSIDESPLKSSMRRARCQALLRFFFEKNLKFYAPEPSERPNVIRSGGRIRFVVNRHSVQFGLHPPLCLFYQTFPYRNTPWRTSLPKLPKKKVLKKALSEAKNFLVQALDRCLEEGRVWDVNMKPSLSSLQLAKIISGSPDLCCLELELSSSSFLSVGGGGFVRSHGPSDDDVKYYIDSEEAELRTPPLQDLTGIQSLDETGMTKGRRLQIPSTAFVRGGRRRRGNGGRGRLDSPDRARANTRDFDDRDRRNSRDTEDRPPKPPSTELTREKEVASDYPQESQKRRRLTGPIDFQDPIYGQASAVPLGGSACGSSSSVTPASYAKERFKYEMVEGSRVELDPSGHVLPRELRFADPQPKMCGLPHPDEGFICCLRELHKELTNNYNASQDSMRRLEGSLKKAENQSTSRLTALEKAQSRCEELERKITRLEKRITELEQQRPSSIDEMVDLWQASEEGKAAIAPVHLPRRGITWPISTLLLIFLRFLLIRSGMVFPGLTMILA
ncbi:hypothetical protein Dimus_031659 [Dionaea muscipula]